MGCISTKNDVEQSYISFQGNAVLMQARHGVVMTRTSLVPNKPKNLSKTFLSIVIVMFAIFLTACANSPARLAMMSDEQLYNISGAALCNAYASSGQKSEKLRRALKERDIELRDMHARNIPDPATGKKPRPAFTEEEWHAIDKAQVFIGMSETAMICSWGEPNIFAGGTINETITRRGKTRQFVYRLTSYSKPRYVYVRDGYVYAVQD